MWHIRQFRTKEAKEKFIEKNQGKIQWIEVFVNNAYAIEYKKLRIIYK